MEKRGKRIMLVGRSGSGKTTLCQYLNHETIRYHKTQTIQIINRSMIDTPGEYLERTNLRSALLVTSVEAEVIVLVQDALEKGTMFPPAYTSVFAKPTIGIVTKCDLATAQQIEQAQAFLKMAGAPRIFCVSSMDGTGFEPLLPYLGLDPDETTE